MSQARTAFAAFVFSTLVAVPFVRSQTSAGKPGIDEKTAGMQKLDGYIPLYWDQRTGTLWFEISRFNTEFLFTTGLAAGLGSNDIGLDRGKDGEGKLVSFERIGPKILLVQSNSSFRSSSPNPAERRSVEDSFAKSVLWGFTVAAENGGRVLVDATDFIVRDGYGAGASLKPGPYQVEQSRSAVYLPRTKSFPKNTEIEVTLTFLREASGNTGDEGGLFSGTIASVTPTPDAVTLREHYSFVELPDNNYRPRETDPRAGYFDSSFVDYSAAVGEPIVKHYMLRHRLEKKDRSAAVSEPVKSIEYWVDPGAPEDVREALLTGAGWWNQAFEAAGFRNAFKVAVLPEGADPMDIRYNMINWVHRSTRGWSMGGVVSDPRTGEIIKGTVTLGSLRDRQDYLIFEGLLSPYLTGAEKPAILYDTALARIRQLAAHEVGHTLGLAHNYYDSERGWISVMDYPHSAEKLRADGTIDLSEAYPARIGDWDKVAIDYGYREIPAGAAAAALRRILDDAWSRDLRFLTNHDTDTHPRADQWSNGVNQADELNRIMKIRRAALDRLGEHTIRNGAPMATIEEPLVPIFMYHRYSAESAASMVAGIDYVYAMRGDGRKPFAWEKAENQRKALDALADTLKPSELTVPGRVLDLIPPRPPGFGGHRELFPRTTGAGFDPISPATVAADVTIGLVLQWERAARMVAQHAVDTSLPGLDEVLDRLAKAVFDAPAASPYEAEVRRAEERVLVDRMTWLAADAPNGQVRAVAAQRLATLASRLKTDTGADEGEQAQHALLASDIRRFLDRPARAFRNIPVPDPPPGAPIGGENGEDWLALPAGSSVPFRQ